MTTFGDKIRKFLIEQFDLGKLKDDIRSRVVYIKNWQMHFSVRFLIL